MKSKATKRGKNKRSREAIYVIPFTNVGGTTAWGVSGMYGRKQIRANFKTEADALARKEELLGGLAGSNPWMIQRPTWLSDEHLSDGELEPSEMGNCSVLVAVR